MKAGIFDPYLDTIGGGERYCLTLAEALLKEGWLVDIFWESEAIREKLIEKFGLKIEGLCFVDYSPARKNLFERREFEKSYDFLFYISDGSLPFMFGQKNFLHFQVPFKNALKETWLNQIKLQRIQKVVCNSLFTKKVVDEGLGIDSTVIYPPVDITPLKPLKKENIILGVGRFSQLLQEKRQDVLIDAFGRLLEKSSFKNWKLILAGGSEIGAKDYVNRLRKLAESLPVEIIENLPFKRLVSLYGQAKIFWSASGYGVDEERDPQKVEHFGISTIEAMAAGAVPLVVGKGGPKETVQEGESGYLWETEDELSEKTLKLIGNKTLMQKISGNAILRSKAFSKEQFYENIYHLIA